jgi:hypothetical protein
MSADQAKDSTRLRPLQQQWKRAIALGVISSRLDGAGSGVKAQPEVRHPTIEDEAIETWGARFT